MPNVITRAVGEQRRDEFKSILHGLTHTIHLKQAQDLLGPTLNQAGVYEASDEANFNALQSILAQYHAKDATRIERYKAMMAIGTLALFQINKNQSTIQETRIKQAIEDNEIDTLHIIYDAEEFKHDSALLLSLATYITGVQGINVSNNELNDEDAKKLAENRLMTQLEIRDNQIGDAGATALALNDQLVQLNVANNPIGQQGEQAFIDAAPANFCICNITGLSPATTQALTPFWERNRKLRVRERLDNAEVCLAQCEVKIEKDLTASFDEINQRIQLLIFTMRDLHELSSHAAETSPPHNAALLATISGRSAECSKHLLHHIELLKSALELLKNEHAEPQEILPAYQSLAEAASQAMQLFRDTGDFDMEIDIGLNAIPPDHPEFISMRLEVFQHLYFSILDTDQSNRVEALCIGLHALVDESNERLLLPFENPHYQRVIDDIIEKATDMKNSIQAKNIAADSKLRDFCLLNILHAWQPEDESHIAHKNKLLRIIATPAVKQEKVGKHSIFSGESVEKKNEEQASATVPNKKK